MIKIIIAGDFRSACCEKIRFAEGLNNLLKESDVNICNFEAPVVSSGAPADKSGPKLDQSEASPAFLIGHGFNVVLIANNHMMDHGVMGCKKTIDSFKSIIAVGAGQAKDAYTVKHNTVKGKTIGYLSLCQHEFGVVESRDEDECGVAWTGSLDVQEIIREAKNKVDYLFVFPHAGIERSFAPLPQWRRLYKKYIDWGADGVIASHPHTPQGWEYYREKPIFYSLGNFYFDELTGDAYWNKGLVAELSIDDNRIKTKVHNIFFNFEGAVAFDDDIERNQHNDYLNELISSDSKYEKYVDELCLKIYNEHKYAILRGFAGMSLRIKKSYIIRLLGLMLLNKRDPSAALNRFQCESHRWAIEYCLKKGY